MWLAALFAVVCPGLGQVYLGRFRQGAIFALVGPYAFGAALFLGAYHPPILFRLAAAGCATYAAIWVAQMASAVVLSWRARGFYVPNGWNRAAAYVGFFVATTVVISVPSRLLRVHVIEPFKTPAGSMLPTLFVGDQFFALKVGDTKVRRRGDIVVFKNPVIADLYFIKRIVGLPGDRIRIADEIVYVNGAPLPRRLEDSHYVYSEEQSGITQQRTEMLYEEILDGLPHQVLQDPFTCATPGSDKCTYRGGEELTVPDHSYFVLGDHRDQSADSRFAMASPDLPPTQPVFVPEANISGRASVIWLSLSLADGVRWRRMGKLLQ